MSKLKLEFKPSSLVHSFEESATLAIAAKAKKMAQEGRSIINFAAGEPDFNTPEPIIERAFAAAKKGQTKYTAVSGTPQLRKAIASRISKDYGVSFEADEVIASCGGKQAIFHFMQAALEPGDEVLILSPYWVSFPEMAKIVGAKPVIVQASGPRITAKDIESKLSSKTRLLILNSPSNPSGTVFSAEEIESFLKVIEDKPIWLLSDDTYYRLVYSPAKWVSALKIRPDFRNRVCIIGSASKSYAMTGWRLGWAIAPKEMIAAMTKLQSQVTSSPSSLSQIATEAAMGEFDSSADSFRVEFQKRRDLMLKGLESIAGVKPLRPDGAFYIFADFSGALKNRPSLGFAEAILEKEGVCVIPGVAFGEPNFLRFSYALSEADILEGLEKIRLFLKTY